MNEFHVIRTPQIGPADADEVCVWFESLANHDTQLSAMEFKAADQVPEYLRIVADVLTWSNVFKVAATAFLARLGTRTADSLWENKSALTKAIRDPAARVIADTSAKLRKAIRNATGNPNVRFSIPVPSDFPGIDLTCPAESEEEIAVYLACFSLKASKIESAVRTFMDKHQSKNVAVRLELLDSGAFSVTITEFMEGTTESVEV